MNEVYDSWVKKAWAEVEDIYQVQAKGVKGRAGGEPYSFEAVKIRAALDTKSNPKGRPSRAAGWVAAKLEELLSLEEQGVLRQDTNLHKKCVL